MLDVFDTSMACVCVFYKKIAPTSKGEVEDGRHIDISIGKGQGHNIKKSLSISRAESNNRGDPTTLGNMEVLSTYVRHPCDSQKPDTQLVGFTIIDVGVIMLDNQPQPSLQQRKTRLATKTKSTLSFGGM
jgi:hypothetical protein